MLSNQSLSTSLRGGMLLTFRPITARLLPNKPRLLRIECGYARFFTALPPVAHKPWFFIQNELFRRNPGYPARPGCPGVHNPTLSKMMAGCWRHECKREGKIAVENDDGDVKNDGKCEKPPHESGIRFLKLTVDKLGDRLMHNILSDDPSL